jgi:hypothetical protein
MCRDAGAVTGPDLPLHERLTGCQEIHDFERRACYGLRHPEPGSAGQPGDLEQLQS